jgi:putative nucleotidyltransferase with HDIG domain
MSGRVCFNKAGYLRVGDVRPGWPRPGARARGHASKRGFESRTDIRPVALAGPDADECLMAAQMLRSRLARLGVGTGTDLDPAVQELLESSARALPEPMPARMRIVEGAATGLFLAAAVALVVLLPGGAPAPGLVVACVLAYAAASRTRFEVGIGFAFPTQLVLVPMLFVLPAAWVPLAAAAALLLAYLPGVLRRTTHPDSLILAPADCWYVVPPALLLALTGAGEPSWSDWPLYLAALALQLAGDFATNTLRDSLSLGISSRIQPRLLGWIYLVDVLLSPVGLLAAFASADQPYAFLLALPTVALLGFFASERSARIGHAVELGRAYRGTTLLLSDVLEADDEYTGDHSRSVVTLALDVAAEMGLDARGRRNVEFGALLHDVGKIAIPKAIINKPGPLTDDEWVVIRTHTLEGQRMLDRVGGVLGEVGRIVRSSHERWDGNGYPDGLSGQSIPLAARIVSCCDAFNAMTTTRPYREAMPLADALAELRDNAGTQFDPGVVDALVRVVAGYGPAALPASVEGQAAAHLW